MRFLFRIGIVSFLVANYVLSAFSEAADKLLGKLIDLGGHRLNVNCTGHGGPTVVVEVTRRCHRHQQRLWAFPVAAILPTRRRQWCNYTRLTKRIWRVSKRETPLRKAILWLTSLNCSMSNFVRDTCLPKSWTISARRP